MDRLNGIVSNGIIYLAVQQKSRDKIKISQDIEDIETKAAKNLRT